MIPGRPGFTPPAPKIPLAARISAPPRAPPRVPRPQLAPRLTTPDISRPSATPQAGANVKSRPFGVSY